MGPQLDVVVVAMLKEIPSTQPAWRSPTLSSVVLAVLTSRTTHYYAVVRLQEYQKELRRLVVDAEELLLSAGGNERQKEIGHAKHWTMNVMRIKV